MSNASYFYIMQVDNGLYTIYSSTAAFVDQLYLPGGIVLDHIEVFFIPVVLEKHTQFSE